MDKFRVKIKRLVIWSFIIFGIFGIALFLLVYQILNLKHDVTDAEYAIIEGWVPDYALEKIAFEIKSKGYTKVYVTGIKNNYQQSVINDIFNENENIKNYTTPIKIKYSSTLIFKLRNTFEGIDSLEIIAYSTPALGKYAHYYVLADNNQIGSVVTSNVKTGNTFRMLPEKKFNYLSIYFDNDIYIRSEDRNLFLDKISIYAENDVFNPGEYIQVYVRGDREMIIPLGFPSFAHLTKDKLLKYGVNTEIIIPVPFEKSKISRTHSAYYYIRKEIEDLNINKLNIYTLGYHARRSYTTAKRTFSDQIEIGVIPIENKAITKNNWYKTKEGIIQVTDELFSLMIAYIINNKNDP